MMIYNDMYEPHAQSVSKTSQKIVIENSLTAELATYKEQVELYERRARFELTEREQNINEQLRLVISDRNFNEETLKKELHSVKLQLASTINHNNLMVEEVTSLKKYFKQKENKYLEDFLDMKYLKEKVEDRLFKQDKSLQTVHMLCRPKLYYNELNKVDIGYKNPLCLTRAKQVQPTLYNGHEIIKDNHVPAIVHNTEDTLEIAKITRRKMNDKMKHPKCVNHKKLSKSRPQPQDQSKLVPRKKSNSVFQRLRFPSSVSDRSPSKEDETEKISKSVFVTNFTDHFSARDLWNVCVAYGKVVDVFIPFKGSKTCRKFAFVCFIRVDNMERLIKNLSTIWIGKFRLHANVVRFHRDPKSTASKSKINAPHPNNSFVALVKNMGTEN
nr:RNA-directed DNA polymerase, eukaryota, nucleotide-binding alpha-beta plait domain protein [Tanacetum cinerariifolium]